MSIGSWFRNLGNKIKGAFVSAGHAIKSAVSGFVKSAKGPALKAVGALKKIATTVYKDAKSGASSALGTAKSIANNAIGSVKGIVYHTEDTFKGIISMPLLLIAGGIGLMFLFKGPEVIQAGATAAKSGAV